MKIKKASAGHLTNFEVLDLLRTKGASKDPTRVMSLLSPSEFKVYDYLDTSAACDQTRESINEFVEKSKEYDLAKAELIELEQRGWDEEKLTEMVEMIDQVLPPRPNQQKSDEEAAEDPNQEKPDEEAVEDPNQQKPDEEAAMDDSAQVGDEDISEEMDAS